MRIAGIVLAAGSSSRMEGSNKLLLPYGKHTVINEVVSNLADSSVAEVVVVTGYESGKVKSALSSMNSARIQFVHNKNYTKGRAESIKCAVRYVESRCDAVLFMVGDKPAVKSDLVEGAIELFEEEIPPLLYIKTPAGRGHPIIFSRTLYDELLQLEGDEVGEALVTKYRDKLIELTDSTVQVDIDTIDDYNSHFVESIQR